MSMWGLVGRQSMLELLGETPVAAMSMAFPQEGVKYTRSQTDAIMAHKFTEVTCVCISSSQSLSVFTCL